MTVQYHLDPDRYRLEEFQRNLASREMIPSRVVLKEKLNARFQILSDLGIKTLGDLLTVLKTKDKIRAFSRKTGLPTDYLTILNREAKSYLPNPVRLDKFSDIPAELVGALQQQGITHSKHLFLAAARMADRQRLAEEIGVPYPELTELVCLADLARLYGFGPVFCRMIYDVGIPTVRDLVKHTPEEVVQIYERETGRKADFGPGEIQFTLDLARVLEPALEL